MKMYTKVSDSGSVSYTHIPSVQQRIYVTIVVGLCEFSFMF